MEGGGATTDVPQTVAADVTPPAEAAPSAEACEVDERWCETRHRFSAVRSKIYGPPHTESPEEIATLMPESDALLGKYEWLARPTEPVILGDRSIAVYNGTPSLNQALAWGLERHELAGLEIPAIGSATFTVQSEMCDDIRARYLPTERGVELEFCIASTPNTSSSTSDPSNGAVGTWRGTRTVSSTRPTRSPGQ